MGLLVPGSRLGKVSIQAQVPPGDNVVGANQVFWVNVSRNDRSEAEKRLCASG